MAPRLPESGVVRKSVHLYEKMDAARLQEGWRQVSEASIRLSTIMAKSKKQTKKKQMNLHFEVCTGNVFHYPWRLEEEEQDDDDNDEEDEE
jgi:hypothetical protein